MDTKICKTCGIEKPLSEYSSRLVNGKKYYRGSCHECELEYKRNHYKEKSKDEAFMEANRKRAKEYHHANKETIKEKSKIYRETHKEQIKEYRETYEGTYKVTSWGRFTGQSYTVIIDGKDGTANISSKFNRTLFISVGGYYLNFEIQ